MATYKTPDVYVEEISLFPPSVAEVETAVPAFIGYTEKAAEDAVPLTMEPTKIDSMVEFQQFFGGAPPVTPTVKLDDQNNVVEVELGKNKFYLYDSLRLFFNNGGGKCYIISVGSYQDTVSLGNDTSGILGALKRLEKEDEPTIIVCPDALLLPGPTDLYDFQQQALYQCAELQDRVLICDLKNTGKLDDDVQEFRDKVGINNLKYGASYVPWLKTNFAKHVRFRDVSLKRSPSNTALELVNLTKDGDLKAFITTKLQASVNAVNAITTKVIGDNVTGDNTTLKEQFDSLVDAYNSNLPYAAVDDFQDELRDIYTLLRDIVHGMAVHVRNSITETSSTDGTANFKLKTDLNTIFKNNKLDDEFQKLLFHHNAPIGFTAGSIFDTAGSILTDTLAAINAATGSTIAAADTRAEVTALYADLDAEVTADTKTEAEAADEKGGLARDVAIEVFGSIHTAVNELLATAKNYETTFDGSLAETFSAYKNILTEINRRLNELPPSGAIAGVYATTDRTRGVWKAPANISIASVIGPNVKIDSKDQEGLNVDVNAGKSINAIRAFTGKGTLVWGARTLAGNDNEWRYISVRRFFNMVEESVKKSTYWAVFEPNDANTWIKVKSMIENYLIQKWRDGALAGRNLNRRFL